MSTLYVFGDSFTQGHHNLETYPAYDEFKKLRGGKLFDLWSQILANKLGFDLKNYGNAGASNDDIFSFICDNIIRVKSGDIVIINWTFITRFRWVDSDGKWRTIHGGPDYSISESTRKETLINKFNSKWESIIYQYENIIDVLSKSVGFNVYYWSAENNLIYNSPNKNLKKYIISELINPGETLFHEIFRRGGKTIEEESNYTIGDIHLGESGHKIQGNLFFNYISGIDESKVDYVNLDEMKTINHINPHLEPNSDPVRIHKKELYK